MLAKLQTPICSVGTKCFDANKISEIAICPIAIICQSRNPNPTWQIAKQMPLIYAVKIARDNPEELAIEVDFKR